MQTAAVLDADPLIANTGSHAFKIVVTGPMGAGKTTFINAVSEIETVATEAGISDGTGTDEKTTTTVGIDFGKVSLSGGLELYLFGTPGQERFEFMWDIVAKGMLGVIMLVDCERPESFERSREMLDYFRARGDVPAIIAANKVVDFGADADAVAAALDLRAHEFVVPTDARDREAVKQTVIELLELVVARLA